MGVNRIELSGRIAEHQGLRHTPAGLASARLKLLHASEQEEVGRSRRVECELNVQAFGPVAQRLAQVSEGQEVTLRGFLDRSGPRDPRPVLHVTEFELI